MNFYQSPYMNPYGVQYQQPQPTQVVRVNGENGARAYQLGANSSSLLLDESGLMVWLVTTDGAGYKTVAAYDIIPHQEVSAPDYGSLENRIKKLEDIVNGYTRDFTANSKKQPYDANRKTNDGNGQQRSEPTGRA